MTPYLHDPSPSTGNDGHIVFRRSGLAIGEQYFSAPRPWDNGRIDVLRYIASPVPPPRPRTSHEGHTLAIDLALEQDRLFSQISSDTRRKIRRALDKDHTETSVQGAPSAEVIAEFADTHDDFAKARSLAPVFRPRLYALAATGSLLLSAARSPEGTVLVWHAYVVARARAHLLYSVSLLPSADDSDQRNMIGRANRLLHWQDIQHAKGRGYDVLDLGGIDVTGRSAATTRIAQFKRNFGGEPTPGHSWSEPRSVRGSLAKFALRLRGSDF